MIAEGPTPSSSPWMVTRAKAERITASEPKAAASTMPSQALSHPVGSGEASQPFRPNMSGAKIFSK